MLHSSFYFVGNYHSASMEIFNYFKDHSVSIYKVTNTSEVDQNDPQEKCVIFFSNAKEALEFLSKAKLPQKSFCALITEREGVFKEEAMKTFEALNLKFYTPRMINKLIGDVDQFLLGNVIVPEELEFSVQLALGKD